MQPINAAQEAIIKGNNLLVDESKWQFNKNHVQTLFACGQLLAKINEIEVPVGADIVVVCSADDADTITAGFLPAIAERFKTSNVALVCTWTSQTQEVAHKQLLTPIQKIYEEDYDKDNCVVFVITSAINREEYAIARTNISRILTDVDGEETTIYVTSPIAQVKLHDELVRDFSHRLKIELLAFNYVERFPIGSKKNTLDWYFNAMNGHIDEALEKNTVPELVKLRRATK